MKKLAPQTFSICKLLAIQINLFWEFFYVSSRFSYINLFIFQRNLRPFNPPYQPSLSKFDLWQKICS